MCEHVACNAVSDASTRRSRWVWPQGCVLSRCFLCWPDRSCRWKTASCWRTWRSSECPSWCCPLPPHKQATGSAASVCPLARPLQMKTSWFPEEARCSPSPRCFCYCSRSPCLASSTGWSSWRPLWRSSGAPALWREAYETFVELHL